MKKQTFPAVKFRSPQNSPSIIEDRFYSGASGLRAQFEERFSKPYSASADRFCWDYWSVKDQYRLLRTPAESFFGKKAFTPFLEHLLAWGRRNLGCQMISHPWLSAYTDGCFQNLHSDVPHGPFSFVFSLTPWSRRSFRGGETFLAKPLLLRYFSELTGESSHEEKSLFSRIPPQFNRLTVFDPRYPHGVVPVHGVESILNSRLVIHGWFTDPRPMLEGTLPFKKIMGPMDHFAEAVLKNLSLLPYSGLLSLRLQISKEGTLDVIEVLTSHLVDGMGHPIPKPRLTVALKVPASFPRASGKSYLTLPLNIQN